jgi:ribosomal protein S27AE
MTIIVHAQNRFQRRRCCSCGAVLSRQQSTKHQYCGRCHGYLRLRVALRTFHESASDKAAP